MKNIWCDHLKREYQMGPSMNPDKTSELGLSTISVHAGTYTDPNTGAVGTPIYQSSTFYLGPSQYESIEKGHAREKFIYSRYGNPSQWSVQQKLSSLEGAQSSLVFSSGMAAISTAVMSLLDPGGHVVTSQDLYGGTYNFFNMELPNMGMSCSFVDPRSLSEIERSITTKTQLLYFEVLTNPLLKVLDIEGVVSIAKKYNLRVILDMTFATPISCQALSYGVDLVVHSASKYLNGHSDLIAGVVSGSRKLMDPVWSHMLNFGGSLDPHACFLLERGLKTLALRMEKHQENAKTIFQYLSQQESVYEIYYPGSETHPDVILSQKYFKNMGGMITFCLKGEISPL